MKRSGIRRKTPLTGQNRPPSRSKGLSRGNTPLRTSSTAGGDSVPARPRVSQATRTEVRNRSRGKCVVCGGAGHQLHHLVEKSKYPEWTDEPNNLVLTCVACHDRHTLRHRAIRLDELPLECVAWFASIGDPWLVYFESVYR